MEVELVARYLSTLPENDDHPYRTGAWTPQVREWNAEDLEVQGVVPEDLDGVYLRNTENPLHPAMQQYHPFDGDGMIHVVGFRGGKAFYRNRFIQTDGFKEEQSEGQSLWPGIAEDRQLSKRTYGWGARGLMKDTSSTDVVLHGGEALTTMYQCGDLYRVSPLTAETLGKQDFHGRFPWKDGVSAHPKIDEHTGEMLFFNYSTEAPYMHYGVVDKHNNLTNYIDVPLPGPRLPHDMVFTENYSIVNDCPLFWDPQALKHEKYAVRFYRDIPTRLGVIPRHGRTADIRWFEFEPTFVLHWVNAYEEGDWLVIHGFFEGNPSPASNGDGTLHEMLFRFLSQDRFEARLHCWKLNLRTGECKEFDISDRVTEFGMINGRFGGRKNRYTYAATAEPGRFLFNGFVKHDLETGNEEVVSLPKGVYGSEVAMAPRIGAVAEDDGYLVTLVTDLNDDSSSCMVFDAASPSSGPIATLRLPERISSGTHSTWAPGTDIANWGTVDRAASAVNL